MVVVIGIACRMSNDDRIVIKSKRQTLFSGKVGILKRERDDLHRFVVSTLKVVDGIVNLEVIE